MIMTMREGGAGDCDNVDEANKGKLQKEKGILLLNFEDYGENRHNEDEDGEDDCDA